MAEIEAGLEKLLHRVAIEQGFKNYKLKVTPVSSGGANYSSTLYVAKIEDNENAINLFTKVAVMTMETLASMGLEAMGLEKFKSPFDGEKYFNGVVSKIYKHIENKNSIWTEQDRYSFPKYYGDTIDESKDMLVFEDLGAKGFTTYDRLKSIDWPYASASVKELAKFHALSMAFEQEYPKKYEDFIDRYSFPGFPEQIFKMLFIPSFDTSVGAVREENRGKLKAFLDNITFSEFLEIYQPVKKKTLIHMDYRPSNLMHRYREDGTVQVIPLDYQTFTEGCPLVDLMYFVFSGSDKEFRRKHFDQLMEHYYTELSAAMTRLGVHKSRYSREDFDQDLKEKLKCGLVLAAQILPIVTVDPTEAPDLSADFSSFTQFKPSEMLVERINDVVDDFVRWGIL